MNAPQVVSRAEWLAARKELLAEEKALTRARDTVTARRRQLPAVEVAGEYVFDGPNGKATLLDMFEGRRQLIVYHFMFGPDDEAGHNGCGVTADSVGNLAHLHAQDTTFALISRAPIERLLAFRERMGWTMPWYSSANNRWSYDFHATNDEAIAPVEYNFMTKEELLRAGKPWYTHGDFHGLSVFFRDGKRVLHTYSAFERGLDAGLVPYIYLDLTPLGRQITIDHIKLADEYTEEELAGSAGT